MLKNGGRRAIVLGTILALADADAVLRSIAELDPSVVEAA